MEWRTKGLPSARNIWTISHACRGFDLYICRLEQQKQEAVSALPCSMHPLTSTWDWNEASNASSIHTKNWQMHVDPACSVPPRGNRLSGRHCRTRPERPLSTNIPSYTNPNSFITRDCGWTASFLTTHMGCVAWKHPRPSLCNHTFAVTCCTSPQYVI